MEGMRIFSDDKSILGEGAFVNEGRSSSKPIGPSSAISEPFTRGHPFPQILSHISDNATAGSSE